MSLQIPGRPWTTRRKVIQTGDSPRQTTKRVGIYKRDYELRINLPSGLEVFSFDIPDKNDRILVRRGDDVSIIHSMNGDVLEDLLAVVDHTTGARYKLGSVGERALLLSALLAAFAAALVGGFAANVGGSTKVVLMIGVAAFASSWLGINSIMQPRARLAADEQTELSTAQSLLDRKARLKAQQSRITSEAATRHAAASRLQQLREKMLSVGLEAYESRLATIERALTLLAKQSALDNRLIAEYECAITMIVIEHEAGLAASALDTDVSTEMTLKFEELHVMEERHRELQRELAADAELDQFLMTGRPQVPSA